MAAWKRTLKCWLCSPRLYTLEVGLAPVLTRTQQPNKELMCLLAAGQDGHWTPPLAMEKASNVILPEGSMFPVGGGRQLRALRVQVRQEGIRARAKYSTRTRTAGILLNSLF